MWNRSCSHVEPENTSPLRLTECIIRPLFFTIISKLAAGSVSKATPMGVPAPLSLFLYLKERWWVGGAGGGGVWGKANSKGLNTQSKHYPMFELHTLSPTVLPHTRTPPLQPAQLNTLLIPGPAHKSDRKSTSDKVSPPQPAGFSWQHWLTCGLLWNKWSNFPNNHLRG